MASAVLASNSTTSPALQVLADAGYSDAGVQRGLGRVGKGVGDAFTYPTLT